MKKFYFSMLELMIVIVVIMILTTISIYIYSNIMRATSIKTQRMAFETIRIAGISRSVQFSENLDASSNKFSLYTLAYEDRLLDQKKLFIEKDSSALVLSVFNTPIRVYVAKTSLRASHEEIESNYQTIVDHEFLTGDFELYYSKTFLQKIEKDGVNDGTFALTGRIGDKDKGVKVEDVRFVYHYKLEFAKPDLSKYSNTKIIDDLKEKLYTSSITFN